MLLAYRQRCLLGPPIFAERPAQHRQDELMQRLAGRRNGQDLWIGVSRDLLITTL
jgi:hypothetical protein